MRTPHPRRARLGDGRRTEPVRDGARPTGMLTVTLRKAISATLLAASLTTFAAACGDDQPASAGPDTHTTGDAPPSSAAAPPGSATATATATATDGTIADRVAYFSSSARATTDLHEVLHDRGELGRFAGQFAASDPKAAAEITANGSATDFSRQVLVGWTATTGCSAATAATLTATGSTLELHVSQPKPPPECLVAFHVTVVFEVPKERIPARPVFG